MPGSNKRVFDVVSVDGIGVCKEKRDYFKAFRNKSVQTPSCEGTYFQVAFTLQFLLKMSLL
jgi:hypothetical protein